jgi:hypothetical protein
MWADSYANGLPQYWYNIAADTNICGLPQYW